MQRQRLAFPEADCIHRQPLTVRLGDINYGRHLGHDALVTLLHEARAGAIAALGFSESDVAGSPSVVAELTVQYRAEAHWGDVLVAETAIPTPTGKGMPVYQRLVREADARTVAVACVTLLWLDPDTHRPIAVPPVLVQAVQRSRAPGSD